MNNKINKINVNGTDYDIEALSGGSVTSVVSETGAVTATQIADALTSAGYKLTDENTWVAGSSSAAGYVPKATKGKFLHSNASTGDLEWVDDNKYSEATTSVAGLMSSTDKTKLNGIATGATAVTESTVSGWGFTKNNGTLTSSDISDMATKTWVGQQGYLTSHLSLSNYATKAYVDDIIGVNASVLSTLTDLATAMEDNDATTGIITVLAAKADSSSLATVATSGSYNDLTNKPTIPSAITENDVSGWGFTKNTGTITLVGNTTSGAVTVSSSNNTASFGNSVTVGTVGGVDLKFTMPSNTSAGVSSITVGSTSYTPTSGVVTVPNYATYIVSDSNVLDIDSTIVSQALRKTSQSLTSGEKTQVLTNLGISGVKNITISSTEPTSSDGNDGDIWLVYDV